MTLLDTPHDTAPEPWPRRPRRLRWFAAAAAAIVVVGGASLGGFNLAERGNVTPLECACGLLWAAPSGLSEHDVTAGPYSALEITAVPGRAVSFDVLIVNNAHVSQTILGLVGSDQKMSAEPVRLQVARYLGSVDADDAAPSTTSYGSTPAALPPHDARWLRFTIRLATNGDWHPGGRRQEYWTSLDLRVRVDGVSKEENVDFGDTAMVVTSPPATH